MEKREWKPEEELVYKEKLSKDCNKDDFAMAVAFAFGLSQERCGDQLHRAAQPAREVSALIADGVCDRAYARDARATI